MEVRRARIVGVNDASRLSFMKPLSVSLSRCKRGSKSTSRRLPSGTRKYCSPIARNWDIIGASKLSSFFAHLLDSSSAPSAGIQAPCRRTSQDRHTYSAGGSPAFTATSSLTQPSPHIRRSAWDEIPRTTCHKGLLALDLCSLPRR